MNSRKMMDRSSLALRVLLALAVVQGVSAAKTPRATFVPLTSGTGLNGTQILVALPIQNLGPTNVTNVMVTDLKLGGKRQLAPATLPVAFGSLAVGKEFIIDAAFDGSQLVGGTAYSVTVHGTYVASGQKFVWVVKTSATMPKPSGGSAVASTTTLASFTTTGAPYPTSPVSGEKIDANGMAGPPVPLGPHVGGLVTSPETAISAPVLPASNRPGDKSAKSHQLPFDSRRDFKPAVWRLPPNLPANAFQEFATPPLHGATFDITDPVVFKSIQTLRVIPSPVPSDPAGDTDINGNFMAAYNTFEITSSTGGNSFVLTSPSNYFKDKPDGGFCCDQIVAYARSINRFLWLIQTRPDANGLDRYRLCSAQPPNLGVANWTCLDITPPVVNANTATCSKKLGCFDYPDMAVGTSEVYISADATWAPKGLMAMRIPLVDIQAGGNARMGYTNPADSANAWMAHVAQNPGSQEMWAGQNFDGSVRVFRWPDNSGRYDWHDVTLTNSWTRGAGPSSTPSGVDWLDWATGCGCPGNAVIGATHRIGPPLTAGDISSDELWLAWMAAAGNGLNQAHVELARIDTSTFSLIEQFEIQNGAIAIGYPALATNQNNEVGIAVGYGGGGHEAGFAVGFAKDFALYATGNSTGTQISSPNRGRWGDYVTIRPYYSDPRLFAAFGYNTTSSSSASGCANRLCDNEQFVVFGRQSDVGSTPPSPPH